MVYILHYFELHTNTSGRACIEIRNNENIKVYILCLIVHSIPDIVARKFSIFSKISIHKTTIRKFPKLKKCSRF